MRTAAKKSALPLLACCLLLSRGAAFPQDPPRASTSSAAGREEGRPLMLTFSRDESGSRFLLDYSARWDFSDLFRPSRGPGFFSGGLSAIRNWDITENTRVQYYGFRTNPWRFFIARERVSVSAPVSDSQMTSSGPAAPVYRKRARLSLSPLVDDFKRSLDESLRNALLETSLRPSGPLGEKASVGDRKSFIRDVLSVDVWDAPALSPAREGLENISR